MKGFARKAVTLWSRETPIQAKKNTDSLWRIFVARASLGEFAEMVLASYDPFRRCRYCQKARQFLLLAVRKE
jgi:hypothetical protein